jgi:protein-S-isoprenylcysteine O-methyltransferase Ste14
MQLVAGWAISLCWVIFAIVWIVAAFATKRTVERPRTWSRWWFVIVVAGVMLIRRQRPGSLDVVLWSVSPAVAMGSVVITLLGLGIAVWARVTLGVYWSANVVLKEDHAVIERGPYRIVRHPIYSGVLLMLVGSTVFSARLAAVVVLAAACAGLWIKARSEERLLSERLPAYARYKNRVKWALVPWLL